MRRCFDALHGKLSHGVMYFWFCLCYLTFVSLSPRSMCFGFQYRELVETGQNGRSLRLAMLGATRRDEGAVDVGRWLSEPGNFLQDREGFCTLWLPTNKKTRVARAIRERHMAPRARTRAVQVLRAPPLWSPVVSRSGLSLSPPHLSSRWSGSGHKRQASSSSLSCPLNVS